MSERSAVQNPMLRYADSIGWTYISPEEALKLRNGDTGLYFTEILEAQLLKLNPGIVTPDRTADILRRLNLLEPTIEGNRDALSWLRGEQSIFVPEENRERNIKLIDFDNCDRNLFHVTDEWRQQGVVYPNRADVVFLINGIPVAVAETKAAGKTDGLAEGIQQIRRYHRETPQMFISSQVFEVTELVNFYYGITWNTSRKNLFDWKEEQSGNYEQKVKAFFDRPRFLKVLRDYIIFLTKDDQLTKVILRQHQTRAVERVIERVEDTTKKRGLIWHTQGSGKTLTMITIAAKLLRIVRGAEKPTVLMLVDRNELETQLFKNIDSYGITKFQTAGSKKELQDILARDDRGLVVSMIHKFDDIPANLNRRESIVVLVDEAHRTTGGSLGTRLMAALPNATFIGFTGTPIDKISEGKGTFKVFGAEDEQGYLDKYSTAQSIEDKTTLRLHYALAPNDLRVDRETLEKEFLNLKEAEGISDPAELDRILRKAVKLKELLKSYKRIDKIAEAVAQHFRENVEPLGFKAFLVAVDREACALYKQALDKYLPPEYSRVVYSPAHNDSEDLKQHYLSDAQEKQVRKAFASKCVVWVPLQPSAEALTFIESRPDDFVYDETQGTLIVTGYLSESDRQSLERLCPEPKSAAAIRDLYEDYTKRLPKILIVTEKLLTGFDAPILYCMYLDKPMRDHVLLQAIARVNRPYEDEDGLNKPYGFVLDFVGIFEQLEKALAFDSDEVNAVIKNVEVLERLFATLMTETAPQYLPLTQGFDDKAKETAIETFAEKETREEFFKFFRQLQTLYDVLSPNPRLQPYLNNYQALVKLYSLIRNAYTTRPYVDKEITTKTKELVRQNTDIYNLELPDAIQSLGAAELEHLKQSDTSDTVKVLNLRKMLATVVREESAAKPFLLSIGDRAETIAQAYENRQIDTQVALSEFEQLAQEYIDANAEQQQLDVDENTYAIHTVLKLAVEDLTVDQAREINAIFTRFPDYQWNEQQKSELRKELYKVVRPLVGASRMINVTNTLLKLQRV